MKRLNRMALMAAVMGMFAGGVMGQMSIEPPTSAPSSASSPPPTANTPAAESVPTTSPEGSSTPSAQNVLEGLLKDKGAGGTETAIPVAGSGGTGRTVESPMTEVAPNAPKSTRVREGEFVWNRTGRLMKDEKSGDWVFEFDSDGTNMKDPPMELLPSRLLAAMEDSSAGGTQRTRFKVSGEVTEYRGKNYLWVQHMEILRDLNKGIGG